MNGTTWYVLIALAAVAAVAVRVAAGRTPQPKTAPLTDPYEIAHLNDGATLVTLAALVARQADGLVEGVDGRQVRAAGEAAADRDPVERAVHTVAVNGPVRLHTLPGRRTVAAELDRVTGRVRAIGLLATAELAPAVRRAWLIPAALGLVGISVGLFDDGAGVALVAGLTAAAVAVLALRPRRRRRTRAAEAELARLRAMHARLAPSMAPGWDTPATPPHRHSGGRSMAGGAWGGCQGGGSCGGGS